MTTLAITPNWKNKTAKFKGTVAAGEHVSVTIQNDNGEGEKVISDASTLRLRVVGMDGRTLAIFPEPVSEGETPETWGEEDLTPLTCTLNLNTVQMLKAVPPAANVPLLWVLDDYDNNTLYFKEQFEVAHWPRKFGEEEPAPTDLDDYEDIIENFNTRLTAAEQTVATAATNAQNAAISASAAASSAATAATAATDAQTGAIAAKNAAQSAADDAATAKTAAEDAQDAAEAAQEAAETAQGKAQEYAEAAAESAATFVVDDTLSVEGAAADAKAVGEANQDLITQIETVQDNLDAEVTARETLAAAVGDNRQNLATEIARAQSAEQGLENRKADKATTYTKAEVDAVVAAATPSDYDSVKARLAAAEGKIPTQASAQNQLADKEFVNSSVATATATFRGTSDAETQAAFETWLDGLTADVNDYVFWRTTDAAGNTVFKRYKYNGAEWEWEFDLNNSSFTAAQWDAISSGITSGLVAKLGALPTAEALAAALTGKQDALTFETSVVRNSDNPVKSSGIWSAIWGALSALPAGFTSLYDWCVAQIAKLRDKLDLNVYGYGNATVALPDGFSITFYDQTYTAPAGGETITFIGPVPSSNPYVQNYKFYYPSTLGTLDAFDPNDYSVWCLVCLSGGDTPDQLMYKTGPSYSISGWNSAAPTLTLSNGEATGGAPTMARPLGATGDTLAKASQLAGKQDALSQTQLANIAAVSDALSFDATHSYAAGDPVVYNGTLYTFTATHTGAWTGSDVSAVDIIARLALKANDNAVVKLTGDQTIGGSKMFTGTDNFYDFTVSHPQGQGYVRIYALANENRVHIEFSDAVSGSHGELSLPVLGGYGAVTLAAIENLAPDAFLMLYDGATVDLNTLYCYQGRLYRCILGYTFASGDSYPSDDTTHWALATVEDVLAALRTAIAGKADVSAIPYSLVAKTISNNAVTLDDRAINAVAVSSSLASLTVNFPTATSGKARDFGLRLTVASGITTAPELALPQGVTCENADGEAPEIGADGAATILYFTETAANVFLVKGEVITAIS